MLAYFYALCDAISVARTRAMHSIQVAGKCPRSEGWEEEIRDSLLIEQAYAYEIPSFCTPADFSPRWFVHWVDFHDPPHWHFLFTYSSQCIDIGDGRAVVTT